MLSVYSMLDSNLLHTDVYVFLWYIFYFCKIVYIIYIFFLDLPIFGDPAKSCTFDCYINSSSLNEQNRNNTWIHDSGISNSQFSLLEE